MDQIMMRVCSTPFRRVVYSRAVKSAQCLFWTALILAAPATAIGQKAETDLESLDLTGRVKEVKQTIEYQRSDGKPNTRVDMIYRFNPDGTQSEFAAYRGSKVEGRVIYSYDSDGGRSEQIVRSDTNVAAFRREVKTDRESRRVQLSDSCSDGFLIYTEKYKYQPDGVVEVSKYDHYNELLRVQHLKYEDGKLTEITGPGDSLEARSYYGGGHLKESKNFWKHKLASYETFAYTFDKFGNWISRHVRLINSETDQAGKETTDYRAITYYSRDGNGVGETTGVRPASDSAQEAEQSPPAIIRKSGGVLQGQAWRRVEPSYPLAARSNHITGQVVVEITIDECGRVVDSRALTGPPELRDAAAHAARGWLFAQTKLDSIPVKVIGSITFNFQM